MITELIGYVADFGIELIKDNINNEREKKEIRDRLANYIKREQSINFDCTPEEEIDFGGLIQYIQTNFLDDVQLRIFGNKEERDRAREDIKTKAIVYAKAHNSLSEERAVKMVETAVDILYDFFNSQQNRDLKLMATQIENTVVDQADEIKEIIEEGNKAIVNEIHSLKEDISTPIDKNVLLMKNGGISEVEDRVKTMLNAIGSTHDLYPYYCYGYEVENGKLFSKPLTKEALEKFPPRFICTGTIHINGEKVDDIDDKTIDYANRHQLPIQLNIATAKKMLGDNDDPVQYEAEELEGTVINIPPKPFPKASPFSICINDDVIFDYILFRINEILDDETIVITNKDQKNCSFEMKMLINVKQRTLELSIHKIKPTNKETLKYLKFLMRAKSGEIVSIKSLSLGAELGRGKLGNIKYGGSFSSIEDETAFYEKIVAIEHYFNKIIVIPKEIRFCDYQAISYLYSLINGDECTSELASFSIPIALTERLREDVLKNQNTPFSFGYVGSVDICIFDVNYEVSIIRICEPVVYHNLEKLKRKVDVLEVGETIKVEYFPASGKKIECRDRIKLNDIDMK